MAAFRKPQIMNDYAPNQGSDYDLQNQYVQQMQAMLAQQGQQQAPQAQESQFTQPQLPSGLGDYQAPAPPQFAQQQEAPQFQQPQEMPAYGSFQGNSVDDFRDWLGQQAAFQQWDEGQQLQSQIASQMPSQQQAFAPPPMDQPPPALMPAVDNIPAPPPAFTPPAPAEPAVALPAFNQPPDAPQPSEAPQPQFPALLGDMPRLPQMMPDKGPPAPQVMRPLSDMPPPMPNFGTASFNPGGPAPAPHPFLPGPSHGLLNPMAYSAAPVMPGYGMARTGSPFKAKAPPAGMFDAIGQLGIGGAGQQGQQAALPQGLGIAQQVYTAPYEGESWYNSLLRSQGHQ